MKEKERAAVPRGPREKGQNYADELQQRFGVRPHLCEMAQLYDSPEKRRPYEMRDGIAVLDISGALTNDGWWWDETDYRDIQDEVAFALEDGEVQGILLRVNSPGGETDNAFETARILSEAKQKKPMWASVDTIAYSAGYLLASTASKIYVSPVTGGVGSIGVYSAHMDLSGLLEKQGVKVTLISAGKGKTDGNPYQPLSAAAKAKIQQEVNRLYAEFTGTVARNRQKRDEDIVALGAALFHGSEDAIGAGLADASGTFEETFAAFRAFLGEQQKTSFSMTAASASGMTSMPKKEIPSVETTETKAADATTATAQTTPTQVDVDALVAKARNEGREALASETEEIIALCSIAGVPEKIAEFVGKKMSAKQVREHLVNARAKASEESAISSMAPPPDKAQSQGNEKQVFDAAVDAVVARMKGAK